MHDQLVERKQEQLQLYVRWEDAARVFLRTWRSSFAPDLSSKRCCTIAAFWHETFTITTLFYAEYHRLDDESFFNQKIIASHVLEKYFD